MQPSGGAAELAANEDFCPLDDVQEDVLDRAVLTAADNLAAAVRVAAAAGAAPAGGDAAQPAALGELPANPTDGQRTPGWDRHLYAKFVRRTYYLCISASTALLAPPRAALPPSLSRAPYPPPRSPAGPHSQ